MSREAYRNYTSTSAFLGEDSDELTAWSLANFRAHVLRHLPVDKHSAILDLGCGYGRYLLACRDAGYTNLTGVDISEEQVAHAVRQLGLEDVMVQDAIEFLAGRAGEYDVVLLMDILEHLNMGDLIELLRRVYRALRKGGTVLVQVPNALAPFGPHLYQDVTHVRAFTTRSMTQCLLLGGFSAAQISHFEVPSHGFSVGGRVRGLMWRLGFKPALTLLMLALYGNRMGGVYTANLLTVARR